MIWDSFLGDLSGWAFVVGALALLVGAASASLLRPFSAGDGVARIRARLAPPAAPAGRLLHGLAAIALGVFVVAQPALALEVIAVVAGALLAYYGASVVLSTLNQPARREEASRHRRRTWAIAGGGAAAVAIVIVALTAGGEHARRRAKAVRTCNGYVELCNRRLDQVVFAGTHNSMSAADSPGWLLANQRRTIGRQLHDGIRLFLIDPHYGVRDSQGRVRTDLVREGNKLNRVAKQLSPAATAALERVNGPLGLGKVAGGQARRLALSQPLRAGRHAHGRRAHDGAPFPRAQPGRGGDLPR